MTLDLTPVVSRQPDPLLFATVSGAHLYGFPSRDSDVDLRGAHLPTLLDAAQAAAGLPGEAGAYGALDAFVVRCREPLAR